MMNQSLNPGKNKYQLVTGWWPLILIQFIVFGLLWDTGLATDDFVHLTNGLSRKLTDNLLPKEYLSVPLLHYTHGLAYYLIGGHLWGYDLLKVAYAGVSVYFSVRFFQLFLPSQRAWLFGFLFVFFPFHDGASFWLTGQYLILSFSFYLFAYVQGAAGRYRGAVFWAALASFASYGSSPIAFGLTALTLLKRRWAHALSLIVPNLVYMAYYIITSAMLKSGTQRLTGEFSVKALAKQCVLQVATFIDSAIGPSAWAKIIYSLSALHGMGIVIGLLLAFALTRWALKEQREVVDRQVFLAALIILILAFGMFALTGLYPQLAFNLGNRVMVYGGFFLAVCLASLPLPRVAETLIVAVLSLSIAGVSTHWKDWNQTTQQLVANIRANPGFKDLPPGARLHVSGYQYSRLGPYCHIDFLTADYVVNTFFALQLKDKAPSQTLSFNRRLAYGDGALLDRKYGTVTPVDQGIWLYDAEQNRLEWVAADAIQSRIERLPDETRHWTQQLSDGWLRDRLLEWVPRLRFAY